MEQLFTIGDALAVRPFATAAFKGQKFAKVIGELNAPKSVSDTYFAPDDPNVYPLLPIAGIVVNSDIRSPAAGDCGNLKCCLGLGRTHLPVSKEPATSQLSLSFRYGSLTI